MNSPLLISDIINYLESIAPPSLQESYDNSGLLTGNREAQIKGVLVTLDCTENIIEEAIHKNCNLIVSHHPIIFKGIRQLTGEDYVQRTIINAIRNDIAIYAIHTNLDNVFMDGVNGKIAEILQLKNCLVLDPIKGNLKKLVTFVPSSHLSAVKQSLFEAGAGNIGNYDQCSFSAMGTGTFRGNESSNPFTGKPLEMHAEEEYRLEVVFLAHRQNNLIQALKKAHPYEEPAFDLIQLDNLSEKHGAGLLGFLDKPLAPEAFLKMVKDRMNLSVIRHTSFNRPIQKVAVCGGSGSFLLNKAKNANADAFVTADMKYHEFFDAENQLMIADIGHYESEFFTKALLKDLILKKFSTFAVLLSEINSNPIKYY